MSATGDALVDLVHGQADEAELGERAKAMDEARVRGAAGGAELGRAAGDLLDRGRQDALTSPGGTRKDSPLTWICELVAPARRVEDVAAASARARRSTSDR